MLIKKIMVSLAVLVSLYANDTKMSADDPVIIKSEWTTTEIKALIDETAAAHGVSAVVMKRIVQCESEYNIDAVNKTSKEYSVGLVQINRLAHPHITVEEAKDPEFALTFLAKNLAKGKGRMWTCYSKFYG